MVFVYSFVSYNLANSVIGSNIFLVNSLGFSLYKTMLSSNRDHCASSFSIFLASWWLRQ